MLLAQKSYVEGGLSLILYCARLVDEERRARVARGPGPARASLLELLAPMSKSWRSQWFLAANDLAIQVHGGSGYTRDHASSRLPRQPPQPDPRGHARHPGPRPARRKVVMDGGAGLKVLVETITRTTASATGAGGEVKAYAVEVDAAVERLVEVTRRLWGTGDPALALANASLYLEVTGHVVVAWMWLEQLLAVDDRTDSFYGGKRAAAILLPLRAAERAPKLDLLASLDRTTLDLDVSTF